MSNHQELEKIVHQIFTPGKGLLAADESTRSTPKRLDPIGLENTAENRRRFRDLLINTSGIEEYLSGVILHDETFWQDNLDGQSFVEQIKNKGMVPGVKVDGGMAILPGTDTEKFTQGLDGLDERMIAYKQGGAGFAKWRTAFIIDKKLGTPSAHAIEANSVIMAIYAGICQRHSVVPIVEPEVLIKGDYSIEEKKLVMCSIFENLFATMRSYGVYLPGVILKTSMVHSGYSAQEWASAEEVGQKTAQLLAEVIPKNIGGVVFLSGGLSGETAVNFLNHISQSQSEFMRNKTSFSFARAVQGEPVSIWAGEDINLPAARTCYLELLKKQSLAERGEL
ncbi:MAG: class I fructose-bisphosphate aldolase [Patescibacteria group bacterium]